MAIFDRSSYGRVLVERMEGFTTEAEWRRAYGEITHFREHLVTDPFCSNSQPSHKVRPPAHRN